MFVANEMEEGNVFLSPFDLCGVGFFVPTVSITLLIGPSVEFLAHTLRNDGRTVPWQPAGTTQMSRINKSLAQFGFVSPLPKMLAGVVESRISKFVSQ